MARKEDCTDTKKIEIALTLSGGGYRAAIFHIGVLSYLYHLKLDDGSRLLDHITVMSTVSGGTITGMLYLRVCHKSMAHPLLCYLLYNPRSIVAYSKKGII